MRDFINKLLRRPKAPGRVWPPGGAHWVAIYRPHLEQFATALGAIGQPEVTLHFDEGNTCTHILGKDGELLAEVVIERVAGKDEATLANHKFSELALAVLRELLKIPVHEATH